MTFQYAQDVTGLRAQVDYYRQKATKTAPPPGGVLDDVRAALARPGNLSEHDAGFYRRLIDSIDQVMSERERLHTAWTSARRRAKDANAVLRLAIQERDEAREERDRARRARGRYRDERDELRQQRVDLRKDLDAVIEERNELRRALPDAALVHVATPEGITPCGAGTHDVTTTALIREATCLECLSTLAQATHGDTLPEEDLVEPGDEVPTLCELADRVTALEELTASQASLLEAHSRALEPSARKALAPARWRDKHHDVWEERPGGCVRLVVLEGRDVSAQVRPEPLRTTVEDDYGPLTPVADETAGGAE